MTKTFCTYFDANYLLKGLALYNSLLEHCRAFELWILCFDEKTFDILTRMQLPHVRLIRREEFEDGDDELVATKSGRTFVEYYWTCTPSLPLYVFRKNPELGQVTYLDADLFFFGPPEELLSELTDGSILIVEQRLDDKEKELSSGRFNVSLISFMRDRNGMDCLNWWRERCIEWCFFRCEDGKLGDQKYLDVWPEKFAGVRIMQHPGGGLAPWNLHRYPLLRKSGKAFTGESPLVLYHFHQFEMASERTFSAASGYRFDRRQQAWVYRPYMMSQRKALAMVRKVEPGFVPPLMKLEGQSMLSAVIDGELCNIYDPRVLWHCL